MTKTVKILIGIGIGIVAFIVLGFGFTIYLSYKGARVPVYQTEISDFEFQQVSMNNKEYAAYVTSEMNELTEVHGVKKLKCFIFHQNINRSVYRIIMVGNLKKTADLSETSEYQLNEDDIPLLSALEFCGISLQKNEVLTQACVLPTGGVYIYKKHFIFDQVVLNKKYLKSDEEMKAFLEKIIRHRSENK
jgi:hypothetical protein